MPSRFPSLLLAACLGLLGACGDDDGGNANQPDAQLPDAQIATCGNGVVEPGEQCDDHNPFGGDGCSATCQWENVCGNGQKEGPEECDGADGVPTCVLLGRLDGEVTCSESCLLEEDCTDDASGLVAWYKLDETGGVVVDSTFGGNGCNAVGGIERGFPGVVESSYLFDGTSAYADCGDGIGMGGMDALTLEVWVKVSEFTPEGMLLSRAVDPGEILWALGLAGSGNQVGATAFRVFFAVQGFDYFAESSSFLPTGQWKHIAAVYDAGELAIFIDGEESGGATQLDTGPVGNAAGARTQLGHLNDTGGQSTFDSFYSGYMDEVKIWRLARTQAQICGDAGGTPSTGGACEISLQ
ncbi:MAG: LamG-like jellyroll fold domain-containing protein [Polyangia bacterium]|jgi:cysteine-rich repeat protein|nr:LamG-like jellyroll fold domain-containing protein [Polyangia bacterium]